VVAVLGLGITEGYICMSEQDKWLHLLLFYYWVSLFI